jgi:phage FluMu gp28-like protein
MGRAKIIPDTTKYFLPSQIRWIKDDSPFMLMEKGRQLGISLSTSYSVVERTAPRDNKIDAWVVSRDEASAKLFLKDVKQYSDKLNIICNLVNTQITKDDKKPSSFTIKYLNERTVTCLSSNANALVGKRGTVVFDEFATSSNQEELLAVGKPVCTWGGQMQIISTHRGYNSIFNNLIREIKDNGNPKCISLHTYRLQDALDEGFLYKLQQARSIDDPIQDMDEADYFQFIRNGCINDSIFGREYCCIPDQDENNFFPNDLITPCMDGQTMDGTCFIGIDFGRTKDSTVVWVLNKHNNHYYTREIKVMKDVEFSEQEITIINLIERYNPVSVGCDNKGIGMHITENLRKKFKSVVALNATANSKESNAYLVKKKLEDKTLHLPKDTDIIADFSNIQKIVTPNGVRFESARNESGHGDRYSALANTIEVAESKQPFFFIPTRS